MPHESREHERKALLELDEDHAFFIESDEAFYPFRKVDNVSVSGAGIVLNAPLPPATPVTLGFDQDDWQIRVQGTVVWCESLDGEPQSPEGANGDYRLGVRFNHRDIKNSSMLFLALREYIDPFGAG